MSHVIKNQITQLYTKARIPSIERMSYSFVRRRKKCGRKEKQENEIGQNLSLCRRKKEKISVRRKSLPDLNDNEPDKLCARYDQMLPLR
jgi:hypothetical protein